MIYRLCLPHKVEFEEAFHEITETVIHGCHDGLEDRETIRKVISLLQTGTDYELIGNILFIRDEVGRKYEIHYPITQDSITVKPLKIIQGAFVLDNICNYHTLQITNLIKTREVIKLTIGFLDQTIED